MKNILMVNGSPLTLIKEGTFRFVEQVNEEKNIRYGSAISSYIKAEAYFTSGSTTPDVSVGDEITYYQRVDVNIYFDPTAVEHDIQMGVFTVTNVKKINKDLYMFEAYDNIYKLNVDFSPTLYSMKSQFPMAVSDFLDAVGNAVSGVSVAVSHFNLYSSNATIDYFYVNGITVKDILEYFAEIEANFIYASANGTITLGYFGTGTSPLDNYWAYPTSYIISPTDQETYTDSGGNTLHPVFYKQDGLKKSDYYFSSIDKYQILKSSGESVFGFIESQNPQNNYLISSNIIADNVTASSTTWDDVCEPGYAAFLSLLDNHLYPMEIHLFPFRNPFRAGAYISYIEGTDGVRFSSIVMKMEVTDSEAVLYCYGDEMYPTQNEDYNSVDDRMMSINTRLNQVEAKIGEQIDTSVISEIATAGSGCTITAARYSQWGNVAQILITVTKTEAATSVTSVTLCTLVSGKRPSINASATSNNANSVYSYVGSNGACVVRGTFTANQSVSILATYILA